MILRTGVFNVSVLSQKAAFETFRHFGFQSGRDTDKAKELGLTLVEPEVISVPAIKELPLTLECRVVCVEKQDTDTMPEEILKEHYPSEKPTPFGGSLENYHYAFYGQIVSAYLIEE